MRIGVVANTSWYLFNFRLNLMSALVSDGHEVVALAGSDGYSDRLATQQGVYFVAVPFTGAGTHPWRELATVRSLRRALVEADVDVVLCYTPKGTIYSSLALTGTRVPVIANISGLGRAFVEVSWLTRLATVMYRLALRRSARTFFQNREDRAYFVEHRLVNAAAAHLLPGSGVDLERFRPWPARPPDGTLRVLMVARLLWAKGVGEFVEAARLLRSGSQRWQFSLLGPVDKSPDSGVPSGQLMQWVDEGLVEYLGTTDDVRPHLAGADCVVLPSAYREGVPRSMLEAAAMAKPVITTDMPGCRDSVDDGISGLLCRPRDPLDLARALTVFAGMNAAARRQMGEAGRRKMEEEFDERIVIDRYRQALAALTGGDHGRTPGASNIG